jgi:LysR family transcriptional regulator, glycine cleavage system transcriptional activator
MPSTSSIPCCKRRCKWFGFETMRKLPLAALRAFAAVFETGGVRPAARALQVTHSAVSRHLRELEAWLGVALVEQRRGNGRIALTVQGQALGKAAIAGLTDLERAVEGVRELRQPNSVVVATTASFAARWLIPHLPSLARSHSWIELSIVTEQAVRNVAEQGADLAIRMGSGPWPDGKCEPIMDDALYPVATRRYWNSIGDRKASRALAKACLLHDRDPAAGWERWFTAYPLRDIDFRQGPRFTSSDLALRAAAQGLGVALGRSCLASADVASGILFRPLGSDRVRLPNAYWLVHANDEPPRPAVRAVAEWIRSLARQTAIDE